MFSLARLRYSCWKLFQEENQGNILFSNALNTFYLFLYSYIYGYMQLDITIAKEETIATTS